MRGYVKRVSQKADKLPKEQILSLLDDLVEENDNLTSILDSISAGLLIVDKDFHLIQTNSIIESMLQFTSSYDDDHAQLLPFWEFIDNEEIALYFKNCADKEITNSSEDFTVMTPGGSVRFLTVSISPLVHKNNLDGQLIIIKDVTETKNQEVLIHRMENLASLTNLAAGMAHEIKNPLGAISIHIQLIQKALLKARNNNNQLPEKKFVEDHIDVVNDEIEHLNKLISDFLLAVRPVNATLELKNPDKIITNTIDFFSAEFNDSGIFVEYKSDNNQPKILLDEKLFRDVILNLSQNSLAAIKSRFSDNLEGKGKFGIYTCVKDQKYLIKISDNGCGMSEETLSKIFEPYYTTKANGTGLGMTMVYKIIKEFSGEIHVNSQVDEGTEFTIILPIPQKNKKLLAQKD